MLLLLVWSRIPLTFSEITLHIEFFAFECNYRKKHAKIKPKQTLMNTKGKLTKKNKEIKLSLRLLSPL